MQCEFHGYDKSTCPECRKASARFYKEKCEWALFAWRGDGKYPRENALDGKFYKSEKVAENRMKKINETPEARALPGGGYVVRPVMKVGA